MPHLYIADDNTDFAEYVATSARRMGWTVDIFSDGKDFLENVPVTQNVALMLLDVNMPELDGIQTISKISSLEHVLRIRFMTGGPVSSINAASTIAKGKNLNVGQSIFKPLRLDTLKEILEHEAIALSELERSSA
ncbi:response regulator [Shimia sp.]|uniref:response regulator n=1 Tax=Shimia sp. TaxID=1954381 RepID=UPI003B8D0252